MDSKEAANWTRHFDNLLWQVTSMFATAIGALLAYSYSNFEMAIALAGLALTIIPVYFAASFRELRRRVNKFLDPELSAALREGRSLHQWQLFVLIFIIFECLWVWLLIQNKYDLLWVWITIGCLVLIITLWLASVGKVTVQNFNLPSSEQTIPSNNRGASKKNSKAKTASKNK